MTRTDGRGKRSRLAEILPPLQQAAVAGIGHNGGPPVEVEPPPQTPSVEASVKVYSVKETAALLGLGLTATYAGISNGEIPAIRIGGKWLVPHVGLVRMFAAAPLPHKPAELSTT